MKPLSIVLAMLAMPLALSAQPLLEGGLFLGVSNYQGEFTRTAAPNLSENNLAVGLSARHYLDFKHAIRANLIYGKISGSDVNYENRRQRGYEFETTLLEISIMGEWEPIGENRHRSNPTFKSRLSPYLFGGLGLTVIQPEVDFGGSSEQEGVQEDLEAGYSQVQIAIPLGAGLKVRLDKDWVGALEIGMRAPFTDYLDGVSQAGNPQVNDWYLFGGASFNYRIK